MARDAPTLYLIVGLPGAGKTTLARRLAAEHSALRLTPDEWMAPLFDASDVDGSRDVLEGRLIWTAAEALRAGIDVVLDFGLWSRDERSALRWLAGSVGARAETIYLSIDPDAQRERVRDRWRDTPEHTWAMSDRELESWRALFEEPDAAELSGDDTRPVPPGSTSWREWIATRWPSSFTP